MTIAITAPKSMVASRLTQRLKQRGTVISIGRTPDSDVCVDFAEALHQKLQAGTADALIHCAASFGGNEIEAMLENEMVNALGGLRVAQLAARMQCRHLIYISSVSAFEQNGGGNSYALSKRHGEENAALACEALGMDLTVLRFSQIYDDTGEARRHQPMLYRIVDCARENRPFELFGSRDPQRNFIFIEDVVSVIERVLDRRSSGTHAVVHPVSYRISEIAAIAFAVFGGVPAIVRRPDKADIPDVWYPKETPLYDQIDYRPAVELPAGLALIRDRMQ